jgi:cell division protein DivIC
MKLIHIFKKRKLFFLNIFLTLYVGTNLIGGERGLISYFENKNNEKNLFIKKDLLNKKLADLNNKNELLSKKIDLDYLDILYREKLKLGKKDEILIKIR